MKAVNLLPIALVFCSGIFFVSGCNCPMYRNQITDFKGHRIYQGQTSQFVSDLLGPPDVVSQGRYVKNSWAGCGMITPGRNTIEWVFDDHANYLSLILWIDGGIVKRLAIVPSDEIRR